MYALNSMRLIGHLTEKPEIRQLTSGISVTDLNVKTTETITKNDGEQITISAYHTVTVWRRSAEIIGEYCNAGSQIFLSGRLKTESWETDSGQKRYKTKMVADDFMMLDARNKEVLSVPAESKIGGGLNEVELLGNTTKNAEARQTATGQSVANFSVATNQKWNDKNTNELREETEFHNVVVWGDLATEVAKNIKMGNRVFVKGRLQTRSWETPEGEKRYTTEVIADRVTLLGARDADLANGETLSAAAPVEKATPKDSTEEVPIPDIQYESDIKPEDLPF